MSNLSIQNAELETIISSDLQHAIGGKGSNTKASGDVPVDDDAHHFNEILGKMEQRRNNAVNDVQKGDWGGATKNAVAYGLDAYQGAVKLVTGGL
jgi:hypothetical protein